MSSPLRLLIFNIKQTIWFGGRPQNIWFPPDSGGAPSFRPRGIGGLVSALLTSLPAENAFPVDLESRMGLRRGTYYSKGQQIFRIRVRAGDHLFVDRLTYNFRSPRRGEIIVFQTAGIQHPQMPQDQFYIKRLVALGGDRVRISNDRHLIIGDRPLDASTPHFENVYGFDPAKPPQESQYSGHVNDFIAKSQLNRVLAPLFPNESTVYEVPPADYMVMGDNTVNSFDSRSWGAFPAANVIGKSFFVYWPVTERFGWGHR
jgi:signal peptidase I